MHLWRAWYITFILILFWMWEGVWRKFSSPYCAFIFFSVSLFWGIPKILKPFFTVCFFLHVYLVVSTCCFEAHSLTRLQKEVVDRRTKPDSSSQKNKWWPFLCLGECVFQVQLSNTSDWMTETFGPVPASRVCSSALSKVWLD